MHSQSQDDTLDLLKEFLPDIEQELRNQIEPELQEEYAARAEMETERIERQAEEEFNDALATLQHEFDQLKAEKERELEDELARLQAGFEEREKVRLAQAQERFLQEHFDDRVMTHPAMGRLEEALESEVGSALVGRYAGVRDKRLREVRVRLESKEQRERAEADGLIRSEIYSQSGLEDVREELQKLKIAVAAQKSQFNVKIARVAAEAKALAQKCKELEYQNSDLLIQQMEMEIDDLQRQFTQQQQSQASSPLDRTDSRELTVDFGHNYSRNKHFAPALNTLPDAQFIAHDIELDSDSDSDSLDHSNSRDLPSLPPPPSQDALSKLLHDPVREQAEDMMVEVPAAVRRVVVCDVGRMLREQWEEDSFDRYLSQRNEKENSSGLANQDSNFQSLYADHLRKLNRESRVPKMRKLSDRAKHQLLLHYGTHRTHQNY